MALDLLLISPPVANVGQAAASISTLTAYLRSRGWSVGQWDASIDAFHHFHSASHLGACRDRLASEGASASLVQAASDAASGIEQAKASLRLFETVEDTAAMERAFAVLETAGNVLSASGRAGTDHTFRHFDISGAWRDWDSLVAALDDPAANPYLAWSDEQAIPRLLASGPKAVGISLTYFSQILPGFTLIRRLKKLAPQLAVAVGGGYLTALGEKAREIPKSVLPVDLLATHEGEAVLDGWLHRVADRLTDRPGAEAGSSVASCLDLSQVPSPTWLADGLDLSRYLVPRYAVPVPVTRGCHWGRCRYCNISSQTSSSYRVRPFELAIQDIQAVMAETGSNWFDLPTDSFRPDHLHAFAKAILEAKLDIRWAAEVLLHPQLTTEVIEALAKSGCVCLRFGMESASPEVLTAMNKPRPAGLAARILRDCRANGIRTSTMLIIGFPTETARQRNETFDFLADHHDVIDFVALHEFNLVPGSQMAADPSSCGLIALPSHAVLQPSIPYRNANGVGLDADQVHETAEAMRDALRDFYPHVGKPWAVAIGGWMTFPWCCRGRP
ncbi:MAG: radical SAM protein [Myxococcales bacterium]